jgi:hypothetical protein
MTRLPTLSLTSRCQHNVASVASQSCVSLQFHYITLLSSNASVLYSLDWGWCVNALKCANWGLLAQNTRVGVNALIRWLETCVEWSAVRVPVMRGFESGILYHLIRDLPSHCRLMGAYVRQAFATRNVGKGGDHRDLLFNRFVDCGHDRLRIENGARRQGIASPR